MISAHPGPAVDNIKVILILQTNIQNYLKLKRYGCQISNFRSYPQIYISTYTSLINESKFTAFKLRTLGSRGSSVDIEHKLWIRSPLNSCPVSKRRKKFTASLHPFVTKLLFF